MIKRYFKLCKETRKVLYFFLFVLLILGILDLIIPIFASNIIDYLTDKDLNLFIKTLIILFVLYFTTNTFSYLACRLYSIYFRESFKNIHKKIINRIYDYNDDELVKLPKGKILSTVNIDSINIAEMADYMFNVLYNFILIISMLIVFIKTNIVLGVILFFVIITYASLAFYLTKKSSYYMKGQRLYQDKLTNLLSQTLNGLKEVKTLNLKHSLNVKYDGMRRGWAKKYMLKRRYYIAYSVILKYIRYISKILLYVISGVLIFNGKITIGTIILLITYFDNIFTYLTTLVSDVGTVRNYNISLERVWELLNNNVNNALYGTIDNDYINGVVTFKNVSFAYKNIATIKNVSFIAMPNKITVIAGKTGSGKTTIFNILLRLYKPDKGNVLIDDINIKEYTKEVYYKNVSVVNQESFLFNMSIKDNLSMVDKDVNKQIEVCKRVGIHDLITKLPKGYNTILSENAGNLSGGQKRLLSLAKTLLTGAEILLFDEVTSQLDPKTTKEIINVLKDLKKDHTVIVITHKEEMMKIADELIILNKGCVVVKGKYNNLSNNKYFNDLINKER